jgi:hypothetical protein
MPSCRFRVFRGCAVLVPCSYAGIVLITIPDHANDPRPQPGIGRALPSKAILPFTSSQMEHPCSLALGVGEKTGQAGPVGHQECAARPSTLLTSSTTPSPPGSTSSATRTDHMTSGPNGGGRPKLATPTGCRRHQRQARRAPTRRVRRRNPAIGVSRTGDGIRNVNAVTAT